VFAPVGASAQTEAGEPRGQIIILRKVPRRSALRQGVPAPPFAVTTNPEVDISATRPIAGIVMGSAPTGGVISDVEAASIVGNTALSAPLLALTGNSTPAASLTNGAGGGLGNGSATTAALQGLGKRISSQVSGVGGTVRRATSGIGDTIRNAVGAR
ncbi:MAG: hypothetical protein MI920_36975, partial [Kiloniellales bacterium]|nr:hypothetical protein [Kiloniellales bacterium]